MSRNLSDFARHVALEVPGCPAPLVDNAVLKIAIDFCEKTHYWRQEHQPITVTKTVKQYRLSVPKDATIETVLEPLSFDGQEVVLTTTDKLNKDDIGWRKSTGFPKNAYITLPWAINLVPIPTDSVINGLNLEIILKPTFDSATLPNFLYDEFLEKIASGAKALLMRMPNKEWTDVKTSATYETLYREARMEAASKARAGYKTEDRRNKSKAHYM